jgi:AraC family transcriptional regulator
VVLLFLLFPFALSFIGSVIVMNETAKRARYETRLALVLDHIYDHLDEPLDIARLAEIACLSLYHWHRIYQAMYGETVATTVRRLRLHRAAGFIADVSRGVRRAAGAVSQARYA